MLLPRNSHLLTHQAAATPNTRLSGTAMPTASRVSFSALMASGSRMEATNTPTPCLSASVATTNSGSSRKKANTSQAETISRRRPRALPRRAALLAALAVRVADDMPGSLRTTDAALQQVDQQQQDERHHQHHRTAVWHPPSSRSARRALLIERRG